MDSLLITLVVIAIAGLSNWLQHRAQSHQEPPMGPPPGTPPRPRERLGRATVPPRPASEPVLPSALERELRRLLGEDNFDLPPSPPVKKEAVAPAPPMARSAPPQPTVAPAPESPPPIRPAPVPQISHFRGSDLAFNRAQHLHQEVTERLRQVDLQTDTHHRGAIQKPLGAPVPPSASIRAIRRNPRAARQAFVASLVFSAPKALED